MPPYPVRGAGGVDLESWWDQNRFQAYQGVSVPGFPNIFTILGPYGYNGSSYFNLIENQSRHILRCIERARRGGRDEDRGHARGERALLQEDALAPLVADPRAALMRSSPTPTTSTSTATARSARRRRSR